MMPLMASSDIATKCQQPKPPRPSPIVMAGRNFVRAGGANGRDEALSPFSHGSFVSTPAFAAVASAMAETSSAAAFIVFVGATSSWAIGSSIANSDDYENIVGRNRELSGVCHVMAFGEKEKSRG
jgi:hypothetical protein